MIKVGVIGAGKIGRLHAENIVSSIPGVELKIVADIKIDEKITNWVRSLGINMLTDDAEKIFNDPEIEAVLICSSTDTHARYIIQAAKAGKHIFCEKPIDREIDEIKKALKAVDEAGVKFQTGFVRRFDHNHKRVRNMVAEGKVGEPHLIKVSSRDPEPPSIEYVKVSGGLFFDMMIHDFDMARYLAGSEVEEVYTKAAVLVDPKIGEEDDVDTAVVVMKFENDAIGIIDNSRASNYGYDQRVEVHGSKGCVQDYNDMVSTAFLSTSEGVFSDQPKWFFLERYNDAFIAEVKSFIDAIINDTEPEVNGMDGLQSVLIAEAAKISLKKGRPVRIDEL